MAFFKPIQTISTPYGSDLWLVNENALPLVSISFSFSRGTATDPEGKAGLTNLLTLLLEEGCGDMDALTFQKKLENHAIKLSLGASHDHISGRLQTLVENLDVAAELLRLALNAPRFAETDFRRVQSQVIAMLLERINDPSEAVWRAFLKEGYPRHPYRYAAQGEKESVEKLTRDDILALKDDLLTCEDLKIAIVGDIDAKRATAFVNTVFGDLPRRSRLPNTPPRTLSGLGKRILSDLDIPQSEILCGFPGLSRHDPLFWGACLVNHLLGGGDFTSRLWYEIREKRGLAYHVSSHLDPNPYSPLFLITMATSNEKTELALSLIYEEIDRMRNATLAEETLEKAKKYLTGSYPLRFDTTRKIARALVALQNDGLTPDYLDCRNHFIDSVTLEDVHKAFAALFNAQKPLTSIAGRPVFSNSSPLNG